MQHKYFSQGNIKGAQGNLQPDIPLPCNPQSLAFRGHGTYYLLISKYNNNYEYADFRIDTDENYLS